MPKQVDTKATASATFADKNTPFFFFDEVSAVNSNADVVKFYLRRHDACLEDETDEIDVQVVAQVATGLQTFALTTLGFYDTLVSMLNRGAFTKEVADEYRGLLIDIQKKIKNPD